MGWVTIEGPLEIFEAHPYFLFEKTVSSGHLHPIAVNLFKPDPQRPGYGCFVECRGEGWDRSSEQRTRTS